MILSLRQLPVNVKNLSTQIQWKLTRSRHNCHHLEEKNKIKCKANVEKWSHHFLTWVGRSIYRLIDWGRLCFIYITIYWCDTIGRPKNPFKRKQNQLIYSTFETFKWTLINRDNSRPESCTRLKNQSKNVLTSILFNDTKTDPVANGLIQMIYDLSKSIDHRNWDCRNCDGKK